MPSSERVPLPPGEVHLYLTDDTTIADAALLAAYDAMLVPEERERQAKFRFERHRRQFLVARALVRGALSLYRPEMLPGDWRFEAGGHGRPAIAQNLPGGLHFNLSHTEGRVVLAVAAAPLLGVDVEFRGRQGVSWELAETFFSAEETAMLSALPVSERRPRFFEVWTLKEAYIKARGLGLSLPLDAFSIRFAGGAGLGIHFAPQLDDTPERWRLWQIDVGADYALALALAAQDAGPWRPRLFAGAPLLGFGEVDCRVLRSSAG